MLQLRSVQPSPFFLSPEVRLTNRGRGRLCVGARHPLLQPPDCAPHSPASHLPPPAAPGLSRNNATASNDRSSTAGHPRGPPDPSQVSHGPLTPPPRRTLFTDLTRSLGVFRSVSVFEGRRCLGFPPSPTYGGAFHNTIRIGFLNLFI